MSLSSMTGYAQTEFSIGQRRIVLHLKSVNHRFLELRWKTPKEWLPFESVAKEVFSKVLSRGSLDFWIELIDSNQDLDASGAQQYFERLCVVVEQTKSTRGLRIPSFLRALILARNSEFWFQPKTMSERFDEDLVLEQLNKLAHALAKQRQLEGQKIRTVLLACLKELNSIHQTLVAQQTHLRTEWELHYKDRLKALAADVQVALPSEERILQELLMTAEKRDVAEELDRIKFHQEALTKLLQEQSDTAVGKKIDFFLQELHREWTTLGNKIRNSEKSSQIVEAKLLLEKIKEQALNLA